MEGNGISIRNEKKNFVYQHLIRIYIFGNFLYIPSMLIFYIMSYKIYKIFSLGF